MRILVVDGEEDLEAALDVLEQTPGNEIQSARTGEEALELTQGQHIDLLITEVFIEPMNGFTLRNKMENRHPEVRTIFLSGYDLSPYAEHTAGYEVIPKPATPEKLFPAIARAMGGGGVAEPEPVAAVAPEPVAAVAPVEEAVAPPEEPQEPVAAEVPEEPEVPPAVAAASTATQLPLPSLDFAPAPAVAAQGAAPKAIPVAGSIAPKPIPATGPIPTIGTAAVAAPKVVPKAGTAPMAARAGGSQKGTVARLARPVAAAVASAADPLLGRTIGSYRIERRLGKGKWGAVYLAIQTSMNRPVAMEMLAAEMVGDAEARKKFVATARAKATVQHPHILSVYEADQAEGIYFYTHEYVDGFTLEQLAARGDGLSEPMALQTIKCVAQGLAHLHHHNIAHSIPDASDIYIGTDGLPYLSNVAQPKGEMPVIQEEVCALAEVIRSMLPGGQAQDRGLQAMLTRMGLTNQMGFQSWPALFQAIQAIEPKIVPADAFKLSAQDQAAIRAVEETRKRQKMVALLSVAGLVVFICLLGGVVWYEFLRPLSQDFTNDMVKIEAGDFIYQDGQKLTLPTFYIDKYEITMAEYGKFLQYLQDHGNPTDFDSPLQPKGRSHVPHDWDIYFGRASSNFSGYRTVRGVAISLDCPVFNVDYFDAYAYAKWRGHRLPTQQEWEKAARGASGNLYPWGNAWDPSKLNAGGDYQAAPTPGYKPAVDGYTWWAPVDALQADRSPYGVVGMAGNVSEWTDSWDASRTYVVIRGGNYKSNSEQALTTTAIKAYPEKFAETLGFRTVSDTPPPK